MNLEWIAIKDKCPDDMEDVLLFDEKEGEYIGYYLSSSKIFIRYMDGSTFEHVTHWMPLPTYPRSKAITARKSFVQ